MAPPGEGRGGAEDLPGGGGGREWPRAPILFAAD